MESWQKEMSENPIYSTKDNLLDKHYQSPIGQRKLKLKQMLEAFQREHHLLEGELFMRSRKPRLVRLRAELYYKIKNELGYSYSAIARVFNVDHTTVMHGYKLYEASNGTGRQDS